MDKRKIKYKLKLISHLAEITKEYPTNISLNSYNLSLIQRVTKEIDDILNEVKKDERLH